MPADIINNCDLMSLALQVWSLTTSPPTLQHTFECGYGAVLSIVSRGDTIFAGCQDGVVKVLDLETKTLVRSLIISEVGPYPG